MQILRKMAKTTAIVSILLMTSIILMAMPVQPAQAQLAAEQPVSGPLPLGATPSVTVSTKIFLGCSPNPIGVGQSLLINMWGHPPTHVERGFENAFQLTITKADGTEVVIGPISTYQGDATSWLEYIVDQVGTWTLKADFFGMFYPAGYYMDGAVYTEAGSGRSYLDSAYYGPSSSPEVKVTVQEQQVLSWPPSPLPSDYWTRPVSAENRDWWPILGHYPETGVVGGGDKWPAKTNIYMSNYEFVPYVQAPNSSHVVWKQQFMDGGLVGGEAGQISLTQPGLSGSGFPTIIYAGRAYDTYSKPGTGASTVTYWRCYDIRTGQLYWERPLESGESAPTFVEYAKQGAEVPGATARAGVTPYLVSIGSRILKYDPYTGAIAINVTGPPSGVSGNTLYGYPYVLSVQNLGTSIPVEERYRLINWSIENNAGYWRFAGGGSQLTVDNFTQRIWGNISWPFSSLGYTDFEAGISVSTPSISSTGTGTAIGVRIMAANIFTGQLLWNITTDISTGRETFFSGSTAVADQGKFVVRMNDGPIYAWDLQTGNLAWKNDISYYPWGALGPYDVASAYGLYFTADYSGVRAIDYDTGETVWTYKAVAPPFESPYSWNDTQTYSWHSGMQVADGKFFSYNIEHTPTQPITRGWGLHCLNATTGELLWNITLGQGVPGSRSFQGAIADGYLAITDEYDGYMYVFGKGKSATTVTAPDVVVSKGTGVVIKGTVLDMSPAQIGTPCVSKESMATQMEYLHMQHPIDGFWHDRQMTGVPVSLTAIDSNGNSVDIGTATTSAYYGTFEMAWTPPEEGTYKIVASFAGDDSYGSSAASTAVSVGPAPTTQETPEIVVPDYTMTITFAAIAIIVAVVLAVAVAVLLLRKR
jgi:outer membrane protein assembly factor BamB